MLSNNDGCVIARSEEVKAMGIKMGAPYFKCRDVLAQHQTAIFSSNYELYADLSRRVMQVLEGFTPDVEYYSIDEAFLGFGSATATRPVPGLAIHQQVKQRTKIPVRVGIAPTKTLSKLASELAKREAKAGQVPVFDLGNHPDLDALLASVPVSDVWGIGRQYTRKLNGYGIFNARQLRDAPDAWVKRHLTVTGLRTVWELRGRSCLPLEEAPVPRKTLIRSRSFGEPTSDLETLMRAVAGHASRAAEKLRAEGLRAGYLHTFITTKHFGRGPHHSAALGVRLDGATAHTPDLIRAARACLQRCFRATTVRGVPYRYRKAGVILMDLVPEEPEQLHLFKAPTDGRLMEVMDTLNRAHGKGTVFLASCGSKHRAWTAGNPTGMKRQMQSPRYTTRWTELPVVSTG